MSEIERPEPAFAPWPFKDWKARVLAKFPEAKVRSVRRTLIAVAPWDEVGRFRIKAREGWIAGEEPPAIVLRKGTRFVHSFWLEDDCKTRLACEVTKIAFATVYWKRVGGSKAEFSFPESKVAKYVRSIIQEAP